MIYSAAAAVKKHAAAPAMNLIFRSDGLERVIGDFDGSLDILICKRSIHEVVMMRSYVNTSVHHFLNPVLMNKKRIVIRNTQIEQRRLTGNNKVKAVVCGCCF